MASEVTINNYTDEYNSALKELFESYYNLDDKLVSPIYYKWLYGENPHAPARMVVVTENGQWIAFMAMIPIKLTRQDMQLVAYYVVNVLVHPQHQGKHLFGRMISAAKEFVASTDAVLMGHPNEMAVTSWKRAKMHFHDDLTPFFVMPKLPIRSGSIRVRNVHDIGDLLPTLDLLNDSFRCSARWRPFLSAEYLNWRYFKHPIYKYNIRLVETKQAPVGFMISRRIRSGINLLIDQFLPDSLIAQSLGQLPYFTVAFLPKFFLNEVSRGLLRVPIRKKIPFFSTYYPEPFTPNDVSYLGFSASDF